MVGVVVAWVHTYFGITNKHVLQKLFISIGIGSLFGLGIGATVSPVKVPQTIAGFHSLVELVGESLFNDAH